jgi:hypothetical protein
MVLLSADEPDEGLEGDDADFDDEDPRLGVGHQAPPMGRA